MTLVLSTIIVSYLFYLEIIRPALHFNRWKERESYEREMKLHQLRVVREFYPVLDNLSLDEIEEKYGLVKVYDTVGKAYLRHS